MRFIPKLQQPTLVSVGPRAHSDRETMKLLHIDSSILGDNSTSRTLSAAMVQRWQDATPGLEVSYRDLAEARLPHLTGGSLAGADAHEAEVAAAGMAEFRAAAVVVVGLPRYNVSTPSQLKTWIARTYVPGNPCKYAEAGPAAHAGGKTAFDAGAYGGYHSVDAPTSDT